MKYSPLIMLNLKHGFYDSSQCPDFSVTANAETLRLLNKHRCIIMPNAYGLNIYTPVDNQQPFIPFDDRSQFIFDLSLQTDEFSLYTGQSIQLSNKDGITLHQAGKTIESNSFDPASINKPLLSIEIQRDFNQIRNTPDEIGFSAKPVLWVYYVVTDSSNAEQLTIIDVDLKTAWQRQTPLEGDIVYAQLQQQYPAAKTIICFVSGHTLVCQESCNNQLQLKQGDETVVDQLPGPYYRNSVTNKSSKPPEAIYQVVKYFTNSAK